MQGFLKSKIVVHANTKRMKNAQNVGTNLKKNKKRKVSAKHVKYGY